MSGISAGRGNNNNGGRGFTLVELLVTIAIIVVLILIMVPVFSGVYQSGMQSKCSVHLSRIYMAAMHYATDHSDNLPKLKNKWVDGIRTSFCDLLIPYLYSRSDWRDLDGNKRLDVDQYEGRNIFHCPAAKLFSRDKLLKGHLTEVQLDYGINHYGYGRTEIDFAKKKNMEVWQIYAPTLGHVTWANDPQKKWVPSLTTVGNPGVVYVADADTGQSAEDIGGISRGTDEWPIQHSFQTRAYRRHRGGHNIVQLDGAVKWYRGDIPQNRKWVIRRKNIVGQ